MDKEKDLEYWKNNAEEDYLHVPISVLRYITVLEQAQPQDKETFLTWYTTGDNKHYVGDKLIEAYKKEVLNK